MFRDTEVCCEYSLGAENGSRSLLFHESLQVWVDSCLLWIGGFSTDFLGTVMNEIHVVLF